MSSNSEASHWSAPLRIRRAGPADAASLAELARRTFNETYGNQNEADNLEAYGRDAFTESRWQAMVEDTTSRVLVVESQEGTSVGYAQLRQGFTPETVGGTHPVELGRIYLLKEWQGRGAGAAMMDRCLNEARELGGDRIWLGVWELNSKAISFYERSGFTAVGTQPFPLGGDIQTDLVMIREL